MLVPVLLTVLAVLIIVGAVIAFRRRGVATAPGRRTGSQELQRVGQDDPTSPNDTFHRHGSTTGIIGGGF